MTNEQIILFAKEHHSEMVEKGFWQDKSMVKKALLIVGELGEALEAHRKGNRCSIAISIFHNKNFETELVSTKFEKDVKDCFEDEIADTMLRLLDFAVYFKKWIEQDIEYFNEIYKFTKSNVDRVKNKYQSTELDAMLFVANKEVLDFNVTKVYICLLEIAKHMNFDLWAHVIAKRKYNATRPFLFGKKY